MIVFCELITYRQRFARARPHLSSQQDCISLELRALWRDATCERGVLSEYPAARARASYWFDNGRTCSSKNRGRASAPLKLLLATSPPWRRALVKVRATQIVVAIFLCQKRQGIMYVICHLRLELCQIAECFCPSNLKADNLNDFCNAICTLIKLPHRWFEKT